MQDCRPSTTIDGDPGPEVFRPSAVDADDNWRSPSNRLERDFNDKAFRFFRRSTDHLLRTGISALSAATQRHHNHHHHHHHHRQHHCLHSHREDHGEPPFRKPCMYFAKGYCRNGDRCHYAHDHRSAVCVDESLSPSSSKVATDVTSEPLPIPVRAPVAKPTSSVDLANATEEQLSRLRIVEIEQLKKRFPTFIHEQSDKGDDAFQLTLMATDPDWPYDVSTVQLRITFPVDYPKSCPVVEIDEADNMRLPPILSKHLTRSANSWLMDTHAYNCASGKADLIFRPFLRWFDKSMEELFTEGLRMVKRNLDAENAGIVFVPFTELIRSADKVQSEEGGWDESDEPEEDDDEVELPEQRLKESSSLRLYPDLQKLSLIDNEVVPAVVSSTPVSVAMSPAIAAASAPAPAPKNTSTKPKSVSDHRVAQKGTEISLRNLQLGENVASVICHKIHVTVQCRRCKNNNDVITDAKRRHTMSCQKCRGQMSITFRPNLMHHYSAVLGYLDLDGCSAFDLPIVDCVFAVECLACNNPIRSDGIHYGQPWTAWCHMCNGKMTAYVDSAKFIVLKSNRATEKQLITLEKKDKRSKANSGTATIQEGRPLPNNGTCRHYKKSYRWFRFPCCGKCYPCDLCHNENEVEHDMKFATRVICGFCAKEQPFSSKIPCVMCGSTFNHVSKGHWEGGKGCRDKTRMSREDSHKYSGLGKTVSKKAKEKR